MILLKTQISKYKSFLTFSIIIYVVIFILVPNNNIEI